MDRTAAAEPRGRGRQAISVGPRTAASCCGKTGRRRCSLRIADALGSRALRTDAVESITCGWLSLVVVIGLQAQLALGAWWVDSVASLAIVWLLVKEGREAWEGDDCCS